MIEVINAKLNSEGLTLEVICKDEILGLHEFLIYKDFKFKVVELSYNEGDEEIVYKVVSNSSEVFKDFDIQKWVFRYLQREPV